MKIHELAKHARSNATTTPVPQLHDCGFSQSPWDILTQFSPPSSPFRPSLSPEVNDYEKIESSDTSISVMEWEECYADVTCPDFDCTDSDNGGGGSGGGGKAGVLCCKTDGKKWQCKREAMYGNTYCEHHLALASKQSSDKKKKSSVVVETEGGKKRVRTKKPKAAAANPHEIYYYSGFGPRWRKKRGDDKEDNGRDNCLSTENLEHEPVMEPSSAKVMIDGLDYFDDDDDEDEEAGLSKSKRARKPVKARSLKSLM